MLGVTFLICQNSPQDVDDLAQVVQVLHRAEPFRGADICKTAVDFCLKNFIKDTSFLSTWLIDYKTITPSIKRKVTAVQAYWGDELDVEVLANFLYSLFILDHKKYKSFIEQNIIHIIDHQNDKGFWKSNWYTGSFYGIFCCQRIIQLVLGNHSSLQKAVHFLISTQNSDGGWGEGKSNATDTALNLMTLQGLSYYLKNNFFCIDSAINYLISSRTEKGVWIASPFIQMNVNRTGRSTLMKEQSILTFKNELLTTAIVLKSLFSARVHIQKFKN